MSPLNFMELCRLCLVKDRVQIPIFEGEGDIRQIFLKIAACLPVKVKKDDKLPKKICDDCMYKVEMLYQFWNTTANAEKQLLEWLGEAQAQEDKKTASEPHVKQESLEQDNCSELAKSLSRVEAVLAETREVESDNDNFASGKAETDSDDEPLSSLEPTTFVNVGLDGSGTNESQSQGEFLAPGAPSTSKTTNATNSQNATSGDCFDTTEVKIENWILTENVTDESSGASSKEKLTERRKFLERNKRKRPKGTKSGPLSELFTNPIMKCEFCGAIYHESEMIHHRKTHPEMREALECVPCNKSFSSQTQFDSHSNRHKIFFCEACNKDFNPREKYTKHMKRKHGNLPKTHVCDICNKTFLEKFELNMHKKNHSGVKDKQCPLCSYATNSTTYMNLHIKKHNNEYVFQCSICGKGFLANNQLQAHINSRHGDGGQLFPCEICNKTYSSKGNLNEHKKQHEPGYKPEKTHQCDECGKAFPRKHKLLKHVLQHRGVFSFKCMLCRKGFSCKVSLDNHMKIHTGEKSCVCDVCGKSFTVKRYLEVHRRSHTGEKPYKCDQCDKAFTQQSSLVVHKRYHTGDRPYSCNVCNKGFVTGTLLKTHQKNHFC